MTDQSSPDIAKAIQNVLEGWFGEAIENMENEAKVRKYLLDPLIKVTSQRVRSSAGIARVAVKPMQLSDGRTDYFVSIKAGDREVTPHVFREEYKAAYHVALYDWLLNGSGEEPDVVEFGPDDWPARTLDPAQPPSNSDE